MFYGYVKQMIIPARQGGEQDQNHQFWSRISTMSNAVMVSSIPQALLWQPFHALGLFCYGTITPAIACADYATINS